MEEARHLDITLPADLAQLVEEKVANGAYASESEMISDGLRALLERESALDHWLHEEVAPTYDAHRAHPGRTRSLSDVAPDLERFMDASENKAG